MARYVQRLRQAQGLRPREPHPGHGLPLVMEGRHKPLTTRRVTRLVLKRSEQRTDADTQIIAQLQTQHPDVAVAIDLAQDLCTMVRAHQVDRFDHWLARAVASHVAPMQRFATGLHADYEAVKAGLRRRWSHGPVEGKINRLKMLKRSMFGRATLDLLSRRFLLAASPLSTPACVSPGARRAIMGLADRRSGGTAPATFSRGPATSPSKGVRCIREEAPMLQADASLVAQVWGGRYIRLRAVD